MRRSIRCELFLRARFIINILKENVLIIRRNGLVATQDFERATELTPTFRSLIVAERFSIKVLENLLVNHAKEQRNERHTDNDVHKLG